MIKIQGQVFLTTKEVAKLLGYNRPQTVTDNIRDKKLVLKVYKKANEHRVHYYLQKDVLAIREKMIADGLLIQEDNQQ